MGLSVLIPLRLKTWPLVMYMLSLIYLYSPELSETVLGVLTTFLKQGNIYALT